MSSHAHGDLGKFRTEVNHLSASRVQSGGQELMQGAGRFLSSIVMRRRRIEPLWSHFVPLVVLLLSGGVWRSRKRMHAMTSLFWKDLEPICGHMRFDHDYFGLRSKQFSRALDHCIDDGLVSLRLYAKHREAEGVAEPPHVAHCLTSRGQTIAYSFLKGRLNDMDGENDRLSSVSAKMLAFNWLPLNFALAWSLLDSTGDFQPIRRYEPSEERICIRERNGNLKDFQALMSNSESKESSPYIECIRNWSDDNEIAMKYRLIPDRIKEKYAYLRIADGHLRLAQDGLEGADSYMPLHLVNREAPSVIRTTIASTIHLLDDKCPGASAGWKQATSDALESVASRRSEAEEALEKRISAAADIAVETHEYPVTCRIKREEIEYRISFDEWRGGSMARRIARQYGKAAMFDYLYDPIDAATNLASFFEGGNMKNIMLTNHRIGNRDPRQAES